MKESYSINSRMVCTFMRSALVPKLPHSMLTPSGSAVIKLVEG